MEWWAIGVLIGMVLFGVVVAWAVARNEMELCESRKRMRKACDEVQAERRAHFLAVKQAEAEAAKLFFEHTKAKHGYTDEETHRLLTLQYYASRNGYPVPDKL